MSERCKCFGSSGTFQGSCRRDRIRKQRAVRYDAPGMQGQGLWSLTCILFYGHCAIQMIDLGFWETGYFGQRMELSFWESQQ